MEPYKPAHLGTAREEAILSQRVGTTVHGSIQLTSSEKVYVQQFSDGTSPLCIHNKSNEMWETVVVYVTVSYISLDLLCTTF